MKKMADISELVKRMRGLAEYVDDCDEAADALEAQAKEIKIYQQTELTYVTRVADVQREYSEMQAKLEARIAELKALLKDCSDELEAEVDASAIWLLWLPFAPR
jgi:peptidoglycan hydrolase CwlO-like protein